MGIYDVEGAKYNKLLSQKLKEIKEFKEPEWIYFVKSSTAKARPIFEEDFWFKRAASILRQMYLRGVVGVSRLRTRYGARKDRGHQPPEFRKGSGKIIRLLLQQSEAAGLVEKARGKKAGRTLSKKGKELLESIKE